MTCRLASLRLAVGIAALLLVAGTTGCGGGGSHSSFVGTLEVENDALSTDRVDSLDIDEVGGPDHFSVNVFLDPGQVFDIDLFPDTYDVTVFWNDGSFEGRTVDVFDNLVTVLTVSN